MAAEAISTTVTVHVQHAADSNVEQGAESLHGVDKFHADPWEPRCYDSEHAVIPSAAGRHTTEEYGMSPVSIAMSASP